MKNNRHRSLGLTDEDVIQMYKTMLLARKVDNRTWLLNRAGKIGFVISCKGHEGAQVGAAFALQPGTDYLLPYYRDHALVLHFGMTAADLMYSNFGRAQDPSSAGRQMPGHFGKKSSRIVTASSPVTTQVPHAAGIALAGKMKGESFVTFTSFGEGSSNQGDFHEGLNFAGVHKLPSIFMCQNNRYAISVPHHKQLACEQVSDRAAGYGMPGVTVEGNDVLGVYEAVKNARERAMNGEGSTLIEVMVERMTAHSSDDDDRSYRPSEEFDLFAANDPITVFKGELIEAGLLSDELEQSIETELDAIVDEATELAEQASEADEDSLERYVYDTEGGAS
ncbi:thiamine pyrophosphate-dependent dehydrogenase E1 component subunit alpha [Bacillaceae bacterium SIJ1]|uniref:thiamine pyrophosphate-dependent dehydrogenase E1 component subunit alpha n=1 Tax=Litoribacterium kuwaitense TaxID=1398745 RepID=UPI0013EDDE36|nr:thiamine pyrophosphate-dependent dehydrogenase E1 component subunit alpha [Litoribacterium kuwaitense]NGP43623.1 thiamine pyrophosphate-dependent dehydrogenase E1 component subunit alpha [Litoribacterium kuwaitense]